MIKPMFSIIIPVYNTEKELERCVRSVTCQTFRDFELILVDDGSRDRSGVICDLLADEDSRIVVIHQRNAGCSEARNASCRNDKDGPSRRTRNSGNRHPSVHIEQWQQLNANTISG